MKCSHGVYNPDHPAVNPNCTLCTPPRPLTDEEIASVRGHRVHMTPIECPECHSTKLTYIDDYNFECKHCGFKY